MEPLLSSIIKTAVSDHRLRLFLFPKTIFNNFSFVAAPSPTPEKECRVVPPILHAAIPVEAVTATALSP